MTENLPWLRFYGDVPHNLDYPEVTLYEALAATARRVPDAVAWDFLGTTCSYRDFVATVDRLACGLALLGLNVGDRLLISMPTSPQGIVAFYAVNKLGAASVLIHPLSTGPEIEHYLNASRARMVLTLDAFYGRFTSLNPQLPIENLILARIPDYLSSAGKFAFWFKKGRKIPSVPADSRVVWWRDLMRRTNPPTVVASTSGERLAAILFSGGTTGEPKGIMLSNRNFIAEGMQVAAWFKLQEGDSILALLPMFHGFGLGACLNAMFMAGGKPILMPVFEAKKAGELVRRKRPSAIAGPPTLFEALARDPSFAKADLSCLRLTLSGADTLPPPLKDRFDTLLQARGSKARLVEGYGLTEAVTGIMAAPVGGYREGSIGIPFPDMRAKICRLGTTEGLPPGEEGEICIAGPAVMLGYLDDREATSQVLRTHADGCTWLHTGDLGRMDADGYFYFTMRLKRMIKSSGFNVYPTQVEAVLYQHPLVAEACVVGVPDSAQIERVKAYVVLKEPDEESAATERSLIDHCHERLIKWSCPREIEFRRELPKTRIGKVDYRAIMAEHVRES